MRQALPVLLLCNFVQLFVAVVVVWQLLCSILLYAIYSPISGGSAHYKVEFSYIYKTRRKAAHGSWCANGNELNYKWDEVC